MASSGAQSVHADPGLREHVMQAYGIRARRLMRLPGADPAARAYRLDTDTTSWFVKLRPRPSTDALPSSSKGPEPADDIGARIGEHLGLARCCALSMIIHYRLSWAISCP